MITQLEKDGYTISDDKKRLKTIIIHSFLTNSSWSEGITFDQVKKSIKNSLCLGVYRSDEQVGFLRVITDYSILAYVCDLFILEKHRNKGLANWLMETAMKHPDLQKVKKWMLATEDLPKFYQRFNFKEVSDPKKYMELKLK